MSRARQTRNRKRMFEDLNHPDRHAAVEFGHKSAIKEDNRVVGHCHSFLLEDRGESINIVMFKDGEMGAYIEDHNVVVEDEDQ